MPPDDPQIYLAHEWMDRARLDLRLARLANADESLAGLVAFHCQQAAEKALKAFLALKNQPLYKTHDLPALLARCTALDQGFDALEKAADALDVYLMVGRYPDTGPAPTRDQAEAALPMADQILGLVEARLLERSNPGKPAEGADGTDSTGESH